MFFIGRIIGLLFVLLLVSSIISSIGFHVDAIPFLPSFFVFPILITFYAVFKIYRNLTLPKKK